MNSSVKYGMFGVGAGIVIYLVMNKHCTETTNASSVDTSNSLAGGAGGGAPGGISLPDQSSGLVSGTNPNQTVITTPPSNTTVNNAPVGTTNTTTIGSTPNPNPIVQPSQIVSGNDQISKTPQPVLPPISKAPPVQVSVPKNQACAPGWIRMPDGKCHMIVDTSFPRTTPAMPNVNSPSNPTFAQLYSPTYNGSGIRSRLSSLAADGLGIDGSLDKLDDETRNRMIGFGRLN